ncbi:MAG: toprim domain-containing protein [Sphingomonadaceae bacterium]|nr:toprim domain-containing protein [Sphingomonadaceae bacterium]
MSPVLSSPTNSSLASVAKQLCEELGGHWSGAKGMARCPAHDDRTPSLGVTLGRRAILFHCFAGCTQDQVLTALARRGVSPATMFSGRVEGDLGASAGKPSHHVFAERIWREATPISDTLAKAYLEARGIRAVSRALRFHPRTPLGPRGNTQYLPAMIAAVTMDHGLVAVHRTFLNPMRPAVAPFNNPKRALGSLASGAVRLFDPVEGRLGLAEGIESALAAKALTQIPCWASLGHERFGLVSIPESVRELHLFVDHDAGGELAEERARSVYTCESRTIITRRPRAEGADWNDALQAWLQSKP